MGSIIYIQFIGLPPRGNTNGYLDLPPSTQSDLVQGTQTNYICNSNESPHCVQTAFDYLDMQMIPREFFTTTNRGPRWPRCPVAHTSDCIQCTISTTNRGASSWYRVVVIVKIEKICMSFQGWERPRCSLFPFSFFFFLFFFKSIWRDRGAKCHIQKGIEKRVCLVKSIRMKYDRRYVSRVIYPRTHNLHNDRSSFVRSFISVSLQIEYAGDFFFSLSRHIRLYAIVGNLNLVVFGSSPTPRSEPAFLISR